MEVVMETPQVRNLKTKAKWLTVVFTLSHQNVRNRNTLKATQSWLKAWKKWPTKVGEKLEEYTSTNNSIIIEATIFIFENRTKTKKSN